MARPPDVTLKAKLRDLGGGLCATWRRDRRRSIGRRLGPSAPRALSRRRARELERRLVWILGSPRSGSSWLMSMIAADRHAVAIDEPTIGAHLGMLMTDYVSARPERVPVELLRVNEVRAELDSYFFSDAYRETWQPLLRDLLLGRFDAEASDVALRESIREPLVVIKEPIGSQGSDLLLAATPGSRLIFLLRDGRDVVDSELDAFSRGGWAGENVEGFAPSEEDRLAFISARAHGWLARTVATQRAYAAHDPERRLLVRYEDLLAGTVPHLEKVYAWLGIDVAPERITAIVDALAFDRIDAAERGSGHFARAASPGLWRENLSESEQRLAGGIIGEKLAELGYD